MTRMTPPCDVSPRAARKRLDLRTRALVDRRRPHMSHRVPVTRERAIPFACKSVFFFARCLSRADEQASERAGAPLIRTLCKNRLGPRLLLITLLDVVRGRTTRGAFFVRRSRLIMLVSPPKLRPRVPPCRLIGPRSINLFWWVPTFLSPTLLYRGEHKIKRFRGEQTEGLLSGYRLVCFLESSRATPRACLLARSCSRIGRESVWLRRMRVCNSD